MTSEMERLDKYRSQVRTRSGPASYVDTGGPGRPVLFVHGVGTSSYLWRNVIAQLDGERRCVAVDLPLHGYTPAAADQDFTLPGLARFVADCCDALELTDFDMVANDTGGAVTQVFAVSHAERLHTLALTNCEAHDNVPPKALLPAVWLARMGLHARLAPRLMAPGNPKTPKRVFGRTWPTGRCGWPCTRRSAPSSRRCSSAAGWPTSASPSFSRAWRTAVSVPIPRFEVNCLGVGLPVAA